jgi:hypothetical protein
MSLASNTTYIAPWLPATGVAQELVLTCNTPSPGQVEVQVMLADGSGPDPSIQVTINDTDLLANYAVPGNSYPGANGAYTALYLSVAVPAGAAGGLRGVQIVDPVSGPQSYPALIFIVAGD